MKNAFGAILAIVLLGWSLPAFSADFVYTRQLSSSEFKSLARNLGQLNSFPAADKADNYGWTGFDVGLGYVGGALDTKASENLAVQAPSFYNMGYVRAVKGFPFSIDVGLTYGKRLGGKQSMWGAEVKYAILSDGIATPAIGLRATYSQVSNLDIMNLKNAGLQLEISKKLPFVTPFGGLGYGFAMAQPLDNVAAKSVTAPYPQGWLGAKISPLPFISLTLAAQYGFTQSPLLYVAQLSAGL